jgi:hypothetical protein
MPTTQNDLKEGLHPSLKPNPTGPVIVKKKLTLARQTAKPFALFFTLPPVPFANRYIKTHTVCFFKGYLRRGLPNLGQFGSPSDWACNEGLKLLLFIDEVCP